MVDHLPMINLSAICYYGRYDGYLTMVMQHLTCGNAGLILGLRPANGRRRYL